MAVEVHDELPCEGVVDYGAYRDFDDLVLTVTTCGAIATATASVGGDDVALVAKVQEGPVVLIGADIDIAPSSAVATIGATLGDVLLSTEVGRATSSLARAAVDLDVVYKV